MEGEKLNPYPIFDLSFKRKEKIFFGGGDHFLFWGWRYPPRFFLKTFPGSIRSFTVKENNISSAVSEILRYRSKKITTLYNRMFVCLICWAFLWMKSFLYLDVIYGFAIVFSLKNTNNNLEQICTNKKRIFCIS